MPQLQVLTQSTIVLPSAEAVLFVGVVNVYKKYKDQVFELSPVLDANGSRLIHYQLPNGEYVSPECVRPIDHTVARSAGEVNALKQAAKTAAAAKPQTPPT